MKRLILACSAAVVLIGSLHAETGGLILDVTPSGERVYSDSLQSSGSDDSSLMQLGFFSFLVSALTALLTLLRNAPDRRVKWVYATNVLFLAFVGFLVDLDVSIANSIRHGDFLLLAGFLISLVPLRAFVRTSSRE